jgi:hypothetical protein
MNETNRDPFIQPPPLQTPPFQPPTSEENEKSPNDKRGGAICGRCNKRGLAEELCEPHAIM